MKKVTVLVFTRVLRLSFSSSSLVYCVASFCVATFSREGKNVGSFLAFSDLFLIGSGCQSSISIVPCLWSSGAGASVPAGARGTPAGGLTKPGLDCSGEGRPDISTSSSLPACLGLIALGFNAKGSSSSFATYNSFFLTLALSILVRHIGQERACRCSSLNLTKLS